MINFVVKHKGHIAAILAPFFISLSVILANQAGQSANPLVISALAPLISVPILFVVALITREQLQLRCLVTELRAPFLKVLLSRSVIGQVMIVYGFTMTTAFNAVLLLRIEPLFVFLWGLYYGRVEPKLGKIALLLALIGGSVLAVIPSGSTSSTFAAVATAGATSGTALASSTRSASATAAGAILNQGVASSHVVANAATAAVAQVPSIATGVPFLGEALVVGSLLFISFSYGPTEEIVRMAGPTGLNLLLNLLGGVIVAAVVVVIQPQQFAISGQSLGVIASYSVVFFVLAASLYFEAFRTLKPWVIASFLSLEVVFSLLLSGVLFHQSFTPMQLLGSAIVVAATIAIGKGGD